MNRKYITLTLSTVISLSVLLGCAAQDPKPDDQPNPQKEQPELKQPDANDVEGLYNYAQALEQRGDEKQALTYYLQTIQLDPQHTKSHIALGQLYMKFNRPEEAKVAYENILNIDRDNPFVSRYKEAKLKYFSAKNIAQNEEYKRALELLNQAPANTPLDPEIEQTRQEWEQHLQSVEAQKRSEDIVQRASLLAYKGQYTEAIELIKSAPNADKDETIQLKVTRWEKAQQEQKANEKLVPIGPQRDNVTVPTVPSVPDTPSAPIKIAYITGQTVNVRSAPSLSASPVTQADKGTKVGILADRTHQGDGYTWSKIRTPRGQVGWVASDFLGDTTETESSSAPAPTYRYITGSTVNVRQQPSVQSPVVDQVAKGERVKLVSTQSVSKENYHWYHIHLNNGKEGWLVAKYLSENKESSEVWKQISGDKVNIRKMASINASVIHVAAEGTRVKLVSTATIDSDGYKWVKIMLADGQIGWVVSRFVK